MDTSDAVAVADTVRDYFRAWFEGDPELMGRVLHPDLAKRGIHDDGIEFDTRDSMVEQTKNGEGTRFDAAQRDVDVHVLHVFGSIATARASGSVYEEFLHLLRDRDGWRILNALWEPA